MKTRIVYEDEAVIVCYKPAGLAAQTARVGQQDVVSELKNYLSQRKQTNKTPYLGVIHRLDQPVEGLLVFAKDRKSAASLTAQLSQDTFHKQYYAIVCGHPTRETGELVDYLDKDGSKGLAIVVTGKEQQYEEAKKAVLQYSSIKNISSPAKVTLMDIHIDTGRFHQIRAQMAHAGMPLLGDSKYASKESLELSSRLGVRNVALCAYKIAFKHPKSQRKMEYRIAPEGSVFQLF